MTKTTDFGYQKVAEDEKARKVADMGAFPARMS